MTRSRRFPKQANGNSVQAVPEADAGLAVVEHHPGGKTSPASVPEPAQPAEVRLSDCCACLDLYSGYEAVILHDNVDLDLVLVPVVEELHRAGMPGSLSAQFLKYERFEKLSQQWTVRQE